MECKAKGKLVSAGLSSPVQDKRNFFHGTVVDIAMGKWLDQEDPQPGWMAAHVEEVLEKAEADSPGNGDGVVKWRDRGDKDRVKVWCKELVTRLEPILAERVLPYDYEPHSRFAVPLTIPGPGGTMRQILLTGETDLRTWHPVRPDEEKPRPRDVYDLKGTEDNSYWRKVTGQLLFYEIATWAMTKHWPDMSALIQPMCDEPVLEFRFTPDHRREMFQVICNVADDIWRKDLPPKADSSGCSWCPVKQACPKYARGRGRQPVTA